MVDVLIMSILHVTSISMAVAVIFPGLRFQQPTTPVQNAMNRDRNATMNRATVERAMCSLELYENMIKFVYIKYKISLSTLQYVCASMYSYL